MKIFLLEDDYSLNEAIYQVLKLNGFSVDRFYNGEKAFNALNGMYDLYLLDINVPDISGLEILTKIKELDLQKKVIIMSADNSVETITKAYSNGCLDYIRKPFHIKELELKLQQFKHNEKIILQDNIYFDTNKKSLFKNDINVKLTNKELQLLSLLIENKNIVTTYDKIFYFVYDDTYNEDSLRSLVKRLRAKVGKESIETIPSVGYMLHVL